MSKILDHLNRVDRGWQQNPYADELIAGAERACYPDAVLDWRRQAYAHLGYLRGRGLVGEGTVSIIQEFLKGDSDEQRKR